jgi:hypothetical protein
VGQDNQACIVQTEELGVTALPLGDERGTVELLARGGHGGHGKNGGRGGNGGNVRAVCLYVCMSVCKMRDFLLFCCLCFHL